ncbi:MAG: protein-glutamate O-methyltransferase CheR [Magnetococcales bacterium]|nr:protein-glutamate O-methyltransferase CheR [Magnetococcales bacterium]
MAALAKLAPEEFQWIRQFMRDHTGVEIQSGKEYFVAGRLTPLLVQSGCPNLAVFFQKLERNVGSLRSQVIDALTTHETLWFRDDSFFDALAETVLPQLLEKARRNPPVRIWSAATATGQEAYSVVMLLDALGRKMDEQFTLDNFFILGTDISRASLAIARHGVYDRLGISRGMRLDFLKHYFTREDDLYEVIPSIRRAVRFEPFNLKNPLLSLGTFDLILCRNVLIYFSEETKRSICERMCGALTRPDGYFAIGASESLLEMDVGFRTTAVGRAVLYQPKLCLT